MTDTLHTRLLAAVQQRMDVARAAAERPGAHWTLKRTSGTAKFSDGVTGGLAGVIGFGDVRVPEGLHIAANDPATVLRHCARDLAVLERHGPRDYSDGPGCAPCGGPWPCAEITDLAAAYGIEVNG